MSSKKKRSGGRRKGLKGLRQAKLTRSGMVRDLVPPAIGIGLAAGTALGVRAYLRPAPGTTAELLYRWAPALGAGAGVLGGLAMYLLGGSGPATSTVLSSLVTGGVLLAMEKLHAAKPGAFQALVGSSPTAAGAAGVGAIVPEYSGGPFQTRGLRGAQGMGAIVMEQLNGNQQQQGADVQLQGTVNTKAFGSRPFQA